VNRPEIIQAVRAYTDVHHGSDGIHRTSVDGLIIVRADHDTPLRHVLYEPALVVAVQGSKDLLIGDTALSYGTGQFLVMSVGLPLLARMTRATPDAPYLAVSLSVDVRAIQDLIRDIGPAAVPDVPPPERGMFIGELGAQQADAVARLAALLETPDALGVLYPSIARELFYWVLRGSHGPAFRRLAAPDGHAQRIADAIALLRADLSATIPVEQLAATAHMSPSSFHQHFKAVTAMSPLQYQKHLRLLEARRLLLSGAADATRAGYEVGYESPSQFSREYARMFGAPPRRDVTGFRAAVG
jgi:AraC-like DNA-binding protein